MSDDKSQSETESEQFDVAFSADAGSSSSSAAAAGGNALAVPRVVKFAYQDFNALGGKWRAKCKSCEKTLVSTPGVTTTYTK
jgi:hypothetical protein